MYMTSIRLSIFLARMGISVKKKKNLYKCSTPWGEFRVKVPGQGHNDCRLGIHWPLTYMFLLLLLFFHQYFLNTWFSIQRNKCFLIEKKIASSLQWHPVAKGFLIFVFSKNVHFLIVYLTLLITLKFKLLKYKVHIHVSWFLILQTYHRSEYDRHTLIAFHNTRLFYTLHI